MDHIHCTQEVYNITLDVECMHTLADEAVYMHVFRVGLQ